MGFENFESFMKGKIAMKFAIRLVLLAIFALTMSVALVSAQDEVTGLLVQGASTFTLEDAGDDTITLTLEGVANTTPLIYDMATGGFLTVELLTDWLATGIAAPIQLRFQYGNPAATLYDYTITANAIPAGEFADGIAIYSLSDVEVAFTEIAGTAPDAAAIVEGDKPNLADLIEDGEYATLLTYVAMYVAVDLDFIDALAGARVERLNTARPSSVGGSCIPNVTCLPK